MSLAAGTRLGAYEILALLGVGGMGEVYRARDTRLGRDVAVKVLPDAFSHDAERLARFEREAQLISELNHPNICALYDIAAAPNPQSLVPNPKSIQFLVMELVEGPTLQEMLAGSGLSAVGSLKPKAQGLPLEDALPIAKQIAEALEAAHEHGVVHRDLKPANIKVRADGVVKVLDFGLARAMETIGRVLPYGPAGRAGSEDQDPAYLQPDLSQMPTVTSPALMTGAGVILGTAAYMSPEQARGKTVDRRADIWAFGCVLFEMLAGRPVFGTSESVSDAIAAVLMKEPAWDALPADIPQPVRTLLRRQDDSDKARFCGW